MLRPSLVLRIGIGVLLVGVSLLLPEESTRAQGEAGGKVYQRALKSTVWIVVPKGDGKTSNGTGTLVHQKLQLVLTNYHVVRDKDKALILFPAYDKKGEIVAERKHYFDLLSKGGGIQGKVVARDPSRDLALIQLQSVPTGAEAIRLADKSVGPGQTVHSIGNPGASGALWVYTSGTVRQVYRKQFKTAGKDGADPFEIDARVVETSSPVNPGDSGGPVLNDKGELVAVTQGHANDAAARLVSYFIDVSEARVLLAEKGVAKLTPPPEKPVVIPVVEEKPKPPPEKPDPKPVDPVAEAEKDATRLLQRAKNLIGADKTQAAQGYLEEIVTKYPATKTAEEAKQLLQKLKK